MPQRARSLLSLVVFATFTSIVDAAPKELPIARGPSHEPQPYRYDPEIWKTVPQEYLDDAPACVLYAASVHLVEPDGAIEAITHEITRLNSRKSVESLGEYRGITFRPRQEKVTLNVARIHKRDGKVVEVQSRNLHLRDVATDYSTYEPSKVLVVSFPMLQVGDVIEIKWTTRGKNAEHHNEFFNRYNFGALDYPIVRDDFVVRVPKGKPFHHATVNCLLKPMITEGDKGRTYRWQAKHLSRLPRDEDKPAVDELRPHVVCSTFASWDAISHWKRKIRANCWECTKEIKQVTGQIIKGIDDPVKKAAALTYWVRRNVRYVAIGVEHDYAPHPPHQVLANRRGDCKDTSQLLAVMLKEAGISVSLVTLGFRGDGQVLKEVPSPWGTHGILLVTIKGKQHWIDTTATLAKWDQLPLAVRDRTCYVTDDKRIRILRTPPLTVDDFRFEQTTHVDVGFDGTTQSRRETTYHGLAALSQRDKWFEVPAGERRRLATKKLLDSDSRARLVQLIVDDKSLRDFDGPVNGVEVFEIPRQFGLPSPLGGEGSGVRGREASFTDSNVWSYLLGYNLAHDRTVPLELYAPMASSHRYVLTVPPSLEFDGKPFDREVTSQWGKFARKLKWGDDYRTLVIDFEFRLEKIRVEPKDFAAFQRFQQEVRGAYRVSLALEPVAHLKNAPKLEAMLKADSKNEDAALALAKLYLKHNNKADARRILDQARRQHPLNVEIWELAVKSAKSIAEKVNLQRQLVETFPDNHVHAVQLGALLIERGDHKLAQPVLKALAKTVSPELAFLAHFHLARSFAEQKSYDTALSHLDAAEENLDEKKLSPLALHLVRGRILEDKGDLKASIAAYEKALRINDGAKEMHFTLARLAHRVKDRSKALRHFRRYAVLVGDEFHRLINAADLALQLGRYEDAEDLANRAREQRFHVNVQRILGLVALRRSDADKAVFHLKRASAAADVIAGLIEAHRRLGDLRAVQREVDRVERSLIEITSELKPALEKARSLLQRRRELLEEIKPPRASRSGWITSIDYFVCADELNSAGASEEQVRKLVQSALEEGRPLGHAYALRGELGLKRGRLHDALRDAELAIKHAPNDARGWHVRGRVRFERLQEKGFWDLAKAVALSDRKDTKILQDWAEALILAGRRAEAIRALRDALKLQPNNHVLQKRLRELEQAQCRLSLRERASIRRAKGDAAALSLLTSRRIRWGPA